MFDQIGGLPLHPLVIHVVVVGVPLVALLSVGFLVPRWRWVLRWPLAVGAVLTAVSGFVAVRAGHALADDLDAGGEIGAAIDEHEQWGTRLLVALIVLAVLAVATAVEASRSSGSAVHVLAVLTMVVALTSAWLAFETGDRGARAVWCGQSVAAGDADSLEDCLR
ncbi:hypothetical protein CLV56_0704 [Mumia flava]|uniref:DUF2231 domain-containing protein n=1 Tax=Mumia flava TaxID=1348852 RepID=A0A2M9BEW5_9ACTN|nr:DUF2231 domain-containing protein [Mumia flava]PJJ56495.1 hypothetical protein CLV56_0704 [Mumia flava]